MFQNEVSSVWLLHAVTDDAPKLSASTQNGAYGLASRARISPSNFMFFAVTSVTSLEISGHLG